MNPCPPIKRPFAHLQELFNQRLCAGHPHIVQIRVRSPSLHEFTPAVLAIDSFLDTNLQLTPRAPPLCVLPNLQKTLLHADVQDVFLAPEYLAIVMDYCNRGDLAEFMAGYIAERVRKTVN